MFTVPGLFFFLLAAIIYFALFPAFTQVINIALPMVDPFTQLVLSLLLPALIIGLLKGYYDSIVNQYEDYTQR